MILLIGCFGNHPFDVAMEQELYRYLDSLEEDEREPDPDDYYDSKLPDDEQKTGE
jgi:hypothetical protein